MEDLATIDDIIRWLGGPRRAAEWLSCTDNAVIHWRHRGIPPAQHLRIVVRALSEGKRISNDLLELPAPEAEALRKIWGSGQQRPPSDATA